MPRHHLNNSHANNQTFAGGTVVAEQHHSLCCEVTIEVVMLAASFMFILGSLCFFEGEPFQVLEIGEILFMVASAVYVVVGALEMCEMCYNAKFTPDEAVWKSSAFHEQLTYLISAMIFLVGCVLYWPGLYGEDKATEALGMFTAAWCFIIGSLGFVVASFWNAMQMAEHPDVSDVYGDSWRRLTKTALFFSIMGGVLFVTGSYLFSLDAEQGCADHTPKPVKTNSTVVGGKVVAGSWCLGVTDQGTVLFVIGSVFYTISSSLNCIKLCMKRFIQYNKHGYCEVGMKDEGDENDLEESEGLTTDRALYDGDQGFE